MSAATLPRNALRGEFTALVAGEPRLFDTTLGTIARIETACRDRSILQIIGTVVTERRAADQMALLRAALEAAGTPPAEAGALAADSTVPEVEAFTLGFMEALGFRAARDAGEGGADPLAGSSAGGAGAASPSAG